LARALGLGPAADQRVPVAPVRPSQVHVPDALSGMASTGKAGDVVVSVVSIRSKKRTTWLLRNGAFCYSRFVTSLPPRWVVYQLAAGNSTDPRIRYNGSPLHHDEGALP